MKLDNKTPIYDTLVNEFTEQGHNVAEIRDREPWRMPAFDHNGAWERTLTKFEAAQPGQKKPTAVKKPQAQTKQGPRPKPTRKV